MANIKSSKKDIRRIITRTQRNRAVKNKLKTLRKSWQESLLKKDLAEVEKSMKVYISALDKALRKNIIHKNKVSRYKSACAQRVKQLS